MPIDRLSSVLTAWNCLFCMAQPGRILQPRKPFLPLLLRVARVGGGLHMAISQANHGQLALRIIGDGEFCWYRGLSIGFVDRPFQIRNLTLYRNIVDTFIYFFVDCHTHC